MSFLRYDTKPLSHGRPRLLTFVALFLVGACAPKIHGCGDVDDCDGDGDCPAGNICDLPVVGLGKECLPAIECKTSADCASGVCLQRGDDEADNPFERDAPGRSVCMCDGTPCDDDDGAGGGS